MISLGFIVTSLIVVLVPGTGVIYTVSTGIAGSKRNSIAAAIGCTLGILPHLAVGILGISAVLQASAQIFKVIKIIGTLYLLYLGYGLLSSKQKIEINGGEKTEHDGKIIVKGILLNLLNPKLTLFFFSFLPQFITNPNANYFSQMLLLSSIFMGLTLVIFALYGILAHYCKQLFLNSPKITRRIQRGFGLILVGFAAKLAFSED
ncbi:LysE family translocator [Sediminispirochaeta smaragdinae]|uniref:Lysine exporter protein (LYSE/YGGA) n=1 Tax=Sediminispirochaeta smaragdinae (strain DSM 11293 / JCM 15392 / SEBR 4228) TaxID=573413 RepID=E1RBR4_SEDSS|nr:LysE family translocator [Sediminispirochaeta smaragdinae]ADK79794.1 Lysine exporter protein (LYSE/YGGA) [Sediminispirochaeta smaragdinae DSM 11293]